MTIQTAEQTAEYVISDELAASVQHLELVVGAIQSAEARLARLKAARTQTLEQIAMACKRVTRESICTMLRGTRPSRSQVRQDSTGTPQATAASFTLPHCIRCRISARRAPNDPSSAVHPEVLGPTGVAVIPTD